MHGNEETSLSTKNEVDNVIAKGFHQELLRVGYLNEFSAGGVTVEEKDPTEEWEEQFRDEISGAVLKPEDVQIAREEEVAIAHKLKVYREATEA